MDNFVAWSGEHHLVAKTKEMVVEFRRARPELSTISILGDKVQVVESYKYLGVHMNNKLDWKQQTEAVYKKGQSRLCFLRKLRSFKVCSKTLCMFYQSVVASAIFFAAISWGSGIRACDSKKLNKLVLRAGYVMGTAVVSLEVVMERRMVQKLLSIMDDNTHPLHNLVSKQKSVFSGRLRQLSCRKDRFKNTFYLLKLHFVITYPF